MKTLLIALSNDLYKSSRARLAESAITHGIDQVEEFDFSNIRNSAFYKNNEEILSNSKGIGYWLWKPYIILKTLERLAADDILIYADAGVEIIHNLKPLLDICTHSADILVCGNANDLNAAWVKRDCFVLMDCDSERFWYASHCDASFIVLRKTDRSVDFLTQWLTFGCNKNIITDLPNICGLPNLPEYVAHRCDQAILSILAEKFKLNLYRIPSQFGNHYKIHDFRIFGEFNCVNQSNQQQLNYYYFLPYHNSPYVQLVNHHRTKDLNPVDETEIQANIFVNQPLVFILKKYLKYLKKLLFKI